MPHNLTPLPSGSVKLLPGLIQARYELNRRYIGSQYFRGAENR